MSDKQTTDRRQMLKNAAIKLACRCGYERTTIKEIAKECGVTVGVIYHYFASKEELFREALADHFPDYVILVPETAKLPIEEAMIRMATVLLDNLRKRGDVMTVINAESVRNPEILSLFSQVVTQIRNLMSAFLEEKMAAGEIARRDPRLLVNLFFGHFFTAFYHKERLGFDFLPELDEAFIRQSVKLMLAGWRQEDC